MGEGEVVGFLDEEVGVDERQDDHAYTFDLDYYSAVAVDAFYESFVAFIESAYDPDTLAGGEDGRVVDAAFGCVVGGEEFEEIDGVLRDDLYLGVFGIAEDPEWDGGRRIASAFAFEGEGVSRGGLDEEYVWDDGFLFLFAVRKLFDVDGKEHFLTFSGEFFFCFEVL